MQAFDLFKGDLGKLKEHLELEKLKVSKFESKVINDVAQDLLNNIQKNAQVIGGLSSTDDVELTRTMDSVADFNEIENLGNNHVRVSNSTQEATYAEFGTGMIGEESPHALNGLGWVYDINSHGERGWRFIGQSGRLVHTLGYPAFSTYHNSFLETKSNLQKIANETMKGVFGDDEE